MISRNTVESTALSIRSEINKICSYIYAYVVLNKFFKKSKFVAYIFLSPETSYYQKGVQPSFVSVQLSYVIIITILNGYFMKCKIFVNAIKNK